MVSIQKVVSNLQDMSSIGKAGDAEPVGPARRIDQIDILRGVALFGVLAVNLLTEFRVSIFAQFIDSQNQGETLDQLVAAYVPLLLESKAFVLFSFLFGVGLAMQHERISKRERAARLLARRLLILLAIGLIHLTLIWNGDILTEYALAGFIALPFLFCSQRALGLASLAFLSAYIAMPFLHLPIRLPDTAWLTQHVALTRQGYGSASYVGVISFEQTELPYLLPLHVFVFPRTVALFLFGAFVWRAHILERPERYRPLYAVTALVGLFLGVTLTVLAWRGGPVWLPSIGRGALQTLAPLILAAGYCASILFVTGFDRGRYVFAWAAPLGRMAFTNYLLQSVVFSAIFFGWGLGLFELGAGATLALGVGVYVIQVALSMIWLRRFRFGPVEWLWRSLMYGVRQPMVSVVRPDLKSERDAPADRN
ncbi:MAG: DUF418 domain-containing protein [Beijerinckiaceae bacterium]